MPTEMTQDVPARIPVVLLQDGALDDITAAMYLMLNTNINLAGIVVTNGESRPNRALAKWEDFIYEYMGWTWVQVVAGCDCAVDQHPNAFPTSWRDGADDFWGMPLPQYKGKSINVSGTDLIIALSNQFPGELVVVITGPHTDMALALKKDPWIKDRIKKIVIMGGAVDVPGNIQTDDPSQTNTSAEWNIWVDALSAAEVFSSGIPLDIIPMDPVPDVELDRAFSKKVGEVNLPGANLMSGLWNKQFGWYGSNTIWIYDLLAANAVDQPENYTWINAPVYIVTVVGPEQGRTVKQEDTSDHIRYARHADEQAVLDSLYDVFPAR